jgi:plastocyanin
MRHLILFMLLLCVLAFAACSDDDDDSGADVTSAPATTHGGFPTVAASAPQPASPQTLDAEKRQPQDGTIEISMENFLFVGNHLEVPIEEPVTIRVTNNDATVHNLRVAGNDGVFETEDDAVTTPDRIEAGAVGELAFAPPISGYFTFRCDFHPTSMGGQIIAGEPAGPPITLTPVSTPTPAASETPAESAEAAE